MKTKHILVVIAGALLTLTSCISDLETLPLNEWDVTSETVYGSEKEPYVQGLARLYFNFVTNDITDLAVSDAGASELIRSFWSCQEASTDEVKVAWPDAWCNAINNNIWDDSENDMVYAVFVRTLQGITFVNEYLRQTAPAKLADRGVSAELAAEIEGFRAEARYLRAYFYWMAMDVFGDVPFTTEDSPFGAEAPKQKPRAEVYKFIVDELTALAADGSVMPEARSNRPRADKGSVLGLLARVYLNAEVYTGTPAWSECKAVCEKIFGLGYSLCNNYEHLFRGDNGENENAYNEFLFYAPYDWNYAQSWGGATFLTCGAINTNELTEELADGTLSSRIGVGNGWLGLHVHEHFVNTHFAPTNVTWGENGTCTIADKRGAYAFITARREKGTFDVLLNSFAQGYGCWKFNNVRSNETGAEYWLRSDKNADRSTDIDYPLIRLGEIYLIYAEACSRLGEGATAQPKMNELAVRTGMAPITVPTAWSDEAMKLFREERARELYWEGHRRTDLIRYNCFTSADYVWPFKGGDAQTGKAFEDYKKLYAIPSSQILANPELKNPEGY
ncbi:MAG: RagB/SusD family nutrient uptake outer membrane protein [Tidjanibacter sp.]|nr:RagB/SusD family nutrient uptake outer membrane protein [Tidjanibacter sp.]